LSSIIGIDEPLGQGQPGQAQARRQRLRRGARVDHVLRRGALQRSHRLAVVAELAVVVVLDDETAMAFGPGDGGPAPVGPHGHAQRVLVGRRHEHGPDVGRSGQKVGARTTLVDRQRDHAYSLTAHHLAVRRESGILHGDDRRSAAVGRRMVWAISASACPYPDVIMIRSGSGEDSPGPAEVLGERLAAVRPVPADRGGRRRFVGAVVSARRAARSQVETGNALTSGEPGAGCSGVRA
jgi:hypothetical protein